MIAIDLARPQTYKGRIATSNFSGLRLEASMQDPT